MNKKSFTFRKTPNGVYVKTIYSSHEDNGEQKVNYYYAKRMNMGEIASYKISGFIKKNKKNVKLQLSTAVVMLALVAGLGFNALNNGNISNANNSQTVEQEVKLSQPTPNTYTSNNQKFLTIDSALEISRYNYACLIEELENFNIKASVEDKFNFDVSLFDHNTFVGVQMRESSLKVLDKDSGAHKGCFQISAVAADEANEVALKLTGEKIIKNEKDMLDPIKSSKACMYIFVKNYEYLLDNIEKNNKKTCVTEEMVIDTYLMGCGNINKEVNGFGYKQKYYSKDVLKYKDIFTPYSNKLFNYGLLHIDHEKELRQVYFQLNNYASARNQSKEK